MNIRPASRDDARELAYLINLAGEGLPEYLWSSLCEDGETAQDVGARRAARDEGGFSYTHAHICEKNGQLQGMILAYAQPDPYETGELSELPEVVRPLVQLESRAPGSWYVNAIATCEACRGRGVARLLMQDTEQRALAAGCKTLSLIVASENTRAKKLYERLGYDHRDSLPVVTFPGCLHGGLWLLMVKTLS